MSSDTDESQGPEWQVSPELLDEMDRARDEFDRTIQVRESRPIWVRLGLFGISSRPLALAYLLVSLLLAVGGVLWSLSDPRFFPAAAFLLAFLWYWLCIRWMDRHDAWNGKTRWPELAPHVILPITLLVCALIAYAWVHDSLEDSKRAAALQAEFDALVKRRSELQERLARERRTPALAKEFYDAEQQLRRKAREMGEYRLHIPEKAETIEIYSVPK
jgi:hypothetical protein